MALVYRKAAPAVTSHALYGFGAKPATWDAYDGDRLVARIFGVRQSYGPRSGYRVEFEDGRHGFKSDTLRDAKSRLERS
jgi:hypothetical protein